mmetsp:Transcript_31765/g.69435  ORF Transcript_31765/g.69435 Transcript_31765/m.69435 type:complete len:719 (+) Transcript_31765:67-2223(+)
MAPGAVLRLRGPGPLRPVPRRRLRLASLAVAFVAVTSTVAFVGPPRRVLGKTVQRGYEHPQLRGNADDHDDSAHQPDIPPEEIPVIVSEEVEGEKTPEPSAIWLTPILAAILAVASLTGGGALIRNAFNASKYATVTPAVVMQDGTVAKAPAPALPGGLSLSSKGLLPTDGEANYKAWYSQFTEYARNATKDARSKFEEYGKGLRIEKAALRRLRGISDFLDDIQKDIYSESWVTLATYPRSLRAYVPLLTYYTDTAFPPNSGPVNEQLRFALKYEVGRMFSGVADFEVAVDKQNVRDVERAFAQVSLAYDRYLKAGNLYTGYDPVTSTTVFFEGIDERQLVYTPLSLDQPRIRDEVLVIQGPDKGKVGRVIWLGRKDGLEDGKILTAVVKLDPNPTLGSLGLASGVKEVKAYPYTWIAGTRSASENYAKDWLVATVAALFSCTLTYPLDTIKVRVQSGLPFMPPGGPQELFRGLTFNLCQMAPQGGFLMAGFNAFTRQAVNLPFVEFNNPDLKFALMIPAGILANATAGPFRVPFEELNKQIQTGLAGSDEEAIQNVFFKRSFDEIISEFSTTLFLVLIRGIPYGALQCTTYELFKEKLANPWEAAGLPIVAEPFVWGFLSGAVTGFLTNPPDVVMTRVTASVQQQDKSANQEPPGLGKIIARIGGVTTTILTEQGPAGFAVGALERAAYFAPEACLWFAAYEWLRGILDQATSVSA